MADIHVVPTKTRVSNFSTSDGVILMSEVRMRESRLFSAFDGPGLGKKRKIEAWKDVAQAFNSQTSGPLRTVDQLKKKYNNIKAEAKSKLSKSRNPPTGGGPPPEDLNIPQKMFLDMAGDAPNVCGIPGGLESDVTDVEKLLFSVEFPEAVMPSTSASVEILPTQHATEPTLEPCEPEIPEAHVDGQLETNETSQPKLQLFPPPGAKKTRNPRADKLESELRIEVLRLEKERAAAALNYIKFKQQLAFEKHEAEMEILKLQKSKFGF